MAYKLMQPLSLCSESRAVLSRFLERGGNFVDTANVYTNGHSEEIIGDHLAANPGLRDRVVPATKFFGNLHPGDPNGGGAGRKAVFASVEQSLRRLRDCCPASTPGRTPAPPDPTAARA